MRELVFGAYDLVRQKLDSYKRKLEALKFGIEKEDCTIHVEKTTALISCAVTAQLICSFVLAYEKVRLYSPELAII